MAAKRPKRTLLFRVLTPVLAAFLAIVLLEGGIRLFEWSQSRITIQEQKIRMVEEARKLYPPPNEFFGQVLERERLDHKNYPSMGLTLRDYEYPIEKPDNTYRIIGLGDSFAWGFGVADNRLTTFKYLECWLNADQDGLVYEVINFAQPGRTVRHYEIYAREYGEQFDPDMLLILYNLNDSYLAHASMVVDRRTESLMKKQEDPLSDISRLYRFIKKRIMKKSVHDYTVGYIKEGYFGAEKDRKWGLAQDNLKGIQKFCVENNIELVVAIFPLLYQLKKNYPFQEEVEEVERFLKSSGIKSVNLLPFFRGKKTFVLWSGPTDSHPNRVAHRIAAEAIYHFLQKHVFSEGS
jgi:hypothetical protein